MRIVLIIVLSMALQIRSWSQDSYIEYYNLTDLANKAWYEKDYEKSLELFEKGFAKVGYVHAANYAKAARSSAILKEYELTKRYLAKALLAGYPRKFLETQAFKAFRKTDQYEALKGMEEQVVTDRWYKQKIDSLHYIDQKILRNNPGLEDKDFDKDLVYSDSLNFKSLLTIIGEKGFPSEKRIGFQGYRKAWVIILHNARLPQNSHFHDELLEYVKKGEYLPEDYCRVIDQYRKLEGLPLVYHHWDVADNIEGLSEESRARIDQKRREVGMPSVSRIKVIRKKGKLRHQLKW